MSRIGKQHIILPSGVSVSIANGRLTVKGPKGELTRPVPDAVSFVIAPDLLVVRLKSGEKKEPLWGTWAAHAKNMIHGVTTGFTRQLEVNGVGYRVALQGNALKFEVGFSNPVLFALPNGVSATVEKNLVTLGAIDRELLGRTAAAIRAIRKPEPYKGKGIKYMDEVIRRKAGKTAKTGV